MKRAVTALAVGAGGLSVGWAGQGVWRQSPDEIWAAFAVVGVLSAVAIAFERGLSKLFTRVVRA